jgi:hypothetical protein
VDTSSLDLRIDNNDSQLVSVQKLLDLYISFRAGAFYKRLKGFFGIKIFCARRQKQRNKKILAHRLSNVPIIIKN